MKGYKEKAKNLLKSISAGPGDKIRIIKEGRRVEGILMPRTEGRKSNHITLKLGNGYNIGVKVTKGTEVEKIEEGEEAKIEKSSNVVEPSEDKPDVTIIGTGGTVASRIDYRTGAVHPAFSTDEIYNSAPEIADIANIKTKSVSNVLSENMNPELWYEIGEAVVKELNSGAEGVIIAHGTDTMGYTASALSFLLEDLSKPVVLVGSQRSSDRPSSDAVLNLTEAVTTAISDLGEVCVVMHESTEDKSCLIHRGTKVRKCHTSRRDAFKSINSQPLGRVEGKNVEFFQEKRDRGKKKGPVSIKGGFEEKVALVKIFPNIQSEIIEELLDNEYKGIILEGTGLGHTPKFLYSGIEKAIDQGVPVAMTSQCIWGRTNMRVYSSGRDLLEMGVFPLEDMLPETAYVKMMWVLNQTKDISQVESLMLENIAGEITERTRADTYPKQELQGD